jgi:hypothetical protein
MGMGGPLSVVVAVPMLPMAVIMGVVIMIMLMVMILDLRLALAAPANRTHNNTSYYEF